MEFALVILALGLAGSLAGLRLAGSARRESARLRALAQGEDAAARALVTSIYSHHDNIIAPQTSSELPGARNVPFGGVGHVALGRNPRVLDAVMQEIAQLQRQHAAMHRATH